MRHRQYFQPLLAFLFAAGLAQGAGAATIVQTFVQPQTTAIWNVPSIAFNSFNATLGTLTAVHLSFSGTWTGSAQLTAEAPATVNSLSLRARLDLFRGSSPGGTFLAQASDGKLLVTSPGVTLEAGAMRTFNGSGLLTIAPLELPVSSFVGTGLQHFSMSSTRMTSFSSGGGLAPPEFKVDTGGTLSLVYSYRPVDTPVPEPGALALAGLALAALAVTRRRR